MNEKLACRSFFLRSLAGSLIEPFIPVFALFLGASHLMIGLISFTSNLLGGMFQPIWGAIAEATRRKKLLFLLGIFCWSILWIPIAFVKNPAYLLILLALQSLLYSLRSPIWTLLFIYSFPPYKRGEINGKLKFYSGMGSFLGTFLAGLILNQFGFVPFLFFLVSFLGILSGIIFIPFKEPFIPVYFRNIKKNIKATFSFGKLKREKKFFRFLLTRCFFVFIIGLTVPFFSVFIVESKIGSLRDIALLSSLGIIFSLLFYHSWGFLVDYLGRRTVMVSCLIPISLIPFIYFISPNIIPIYLYKPIASISWAGFNLAISVYLADILPKERGASYVALYNLLSTLASSSGRIVGGILAYFLGFKILFLVSMVLRIISIYFFSRLGEKTGKRPRGMFYFGFDFFGMVYVIESFVNSYSLVIERVYIRFKRRKLKKLRILKPKRKK